MIYELTILTPEKSNAEDLANIKKTIEKWEQGVNNINGSSAVLLRLLESNPELLHQLYSVKYEVEGKPEEENYKTFASATVTEVPKVYRAPVVKFPFVAML